MNNTATLLPAGAYRLELVTAAGHDKLVVTCRVLHAAVLRMKFEQATMLDALPNVERIRQLVADLEAVGARVGLMMHDEVTIEASPGRMSEALEIWERYHAQVPLTLENRMELARQ